MMVYNGLLLLLLVMLHAVADVQASPFRRRRNLLCQNSCLAPSTPTTSNNSNHGTTTTLDVAAPTMKAPVKQQDDEPSGWASIFKRPSFDIVPLPRQAQKRERRPKESRNRSKASRQQPARETSGTRFDLRRPSPERIARWFAPALGDDGWQNKKKKKPIFNHDSVGMTNPVLHVSVEDSNNNNLRFDEVSLASTSTTTDQSFELQDSWIPASNIGSTQQHPRQPSSKMEAARVLQYKLRAQPPDAGAAEQAWFPAGSSNSQSKWRQCRYRRRVGQGQACYERVREAALGWQFQHANKGILPVQQQQRQQEQRRSGDKGDDCFALNDQAARQVQPLWSGPHTQGSRRLVTFTTTGFKTRWLPKLYTMNPVMVVYDLLDQRGPGTTYTSTAYATLRGHLLRGEERVTVAFRDDSGFVDVEILSYSRPAASMKAKFVWPFIGQMQQQFFQHQLDYLESVASKPPTTVKP